MPTLLDKGHALMERLLGSSGGVAVRYVHYRKDLVTGLPVQHSFIDITAESGDCIVGRTVFASNRQDGARIEFGERDYIIKAATLWFGEPVEGDRIIQEFPAAEGDTFGPIHTYEIMPTDTGEPAWRWSDPQKTRYRIHVKRVKVA